MATELNAFRHSQSNFKMDYCIEFCQTVKKEYAN